MKKNQIVLFVLLITCFFIPKSAFAEKLQNETKYFFENSAYGTMRAIACKKIKEKMSTNGKKYNFSKDDIKMVEVDLNDDKITDFIAAVDSKKCSDCIGLIILSHKYPLHKPKNSFNKFTDYVPSYYEYLDILFSPNTAYPVYILNSKTNNSKDIMINNNALLKYDGKKYFIVVGTINN